MCTHLAHRYVHPTGTKTNFLVWCGCLLCATWVHIHARPMFESKLETMNHVLSMSYLALKADVPSALWLNLKFAKKQK